MSGLFSLLGDRRAGREDQVERPRSGLRVEGGAKGGRGGRLEGTWRRSDRRVAGRSLDDAERWRLALQSTCGLFTCVCISSEPRVMTFLFTADVSE